MLRPVQAQVPATVCAMVKRVPRTQVDEQASPKSTQPRRNTTFVPNQRAPHQWDHRQAQARPFINVTSEIQHQQPNEDAPTLTLSSDGPRIHHPHIVTYSLNDLFPGLRMSELFASSTDFRCAVRDSIRADVYDTTPSYHNLSEKARRVLLLPDSSLQGSWQCQTSPGRTQLWARETIPSATEKSDENPHILVAALLPNLPLRMTRLTQVLRDFLGTNSPTGDEFMDTIGSLCGTAAASHWMDIVGVLNRRVSHSWHQDTARSPDNCHTVLLGFPPTDHYNGVGVFSHVIRLSHEQQQQQLNVPLSIVNDDVDDTVLPAFPLLNPDDSSQWPLQLDQPRVYSDEVIQAAVAVTMQCDRDGNDLETASVQRFIVRPRFAFGREIIAYRDVDVLHSAPDVAYRMSLMRFM